ncbi:LuxR C-terminal-related transcriptional regulator [Sphingoaurantiacus capsulatus]|uniref:LuxR C-terminal-related transcriptional regulator n=1 Tax=Sphingoaurantiacus capsulatus TaxID=1771310 RepID=A0ABV7XAB0_9SPHN
MGLDSEQGWQTVEALVDAVADVGAANGLPFVAAQSDLGDPGPMSDAHGQPYGEQRLRWIDEASPYWRNRRLALDAQFLNAARVTAEPFFYTGGKLASWRPTALLDGFDCHNVTEATGIAAAIIAPAHLPRGRLGAVVWVARHPIDVRAVFAAEAERWQALALKLVAAHAEVTTKRPLTGKLKTLSRREVQCLRWAAAGKTDGEIGIILGLSVSTVRFHLRNAATKLGTTGRAQAIQTAAGLGFVGAR